MFVGLFVDLISTDMSTSNESMFNESIDYNIFDSIMKLDFENAYNQTIKETGEFDPFKFWFMRRFMHEQVDAYAYLFSHINNKTEVISYTEELANLMLCRLTSESITAREKIVVDLEETLKRILLVSRDININYQQNKTLFREIADLEEIVATEKRKGSFSKEDILLMVGSNRPEITRKFMRLIERHEIEIKDAIVYLKKLCKINPKAYKYLGDYEYYTNNDVDRALDYYWAGSEQNQAECIFGLARILHTVYDDAESAKSYIEKGIQLKELAEGLFILYKITGNGIYLHKSALKGYIPGMVEYFEKTHLDLNENAIKSALSLTKFHRHLMKMEREALNAFKNGNYTKSFLIYLYLVEYDFSQARKNVLFLLKHHKKEIADQIDEKYSQFIVKLNIKTESKITTNITANYNRFDFIDKSFVDVVLFTLLEFECISDDSAYLNDLGLCYLNGVGTKKDFYSAYSSFKTASKNKLASKYYEAEMVREGKGVIKNYNYSFKLISRDVFGSFPIVYYALKIRFFIKTLHKDILMQYLAKISMGIITIILMRMTIVRIR